MSAYKATINSEVEIEANTMSQLLDKASEIANNYHYREDEIIIETLDHKTITMYRDNYNTNNREWRVRRVC